MIILYTNLLNTHKKLALYFHLFSEPRRQLIIPSFPVQHQKTEQVSTYLWRNDLKAGCCTALTEIIIFSLILIHFNLITPRVVV
jgi:hypothetical protein